MGKLFELIKKAQNSFLIFIVLAMAGCGGGFLEGGFPVDEVRNIDGSENNLENISWGSSGVPLKRIAHSAYSDGISSPARDQAPNPREISQVIFDQPTSIPNARGLSNFVFMWGQFVDHDIDLTLTNETEPWPIPVPLGDPFFDPQSTGLVEIPFERSIFDPASGTGADNPRQQINTITAWIDASNVYGSDETRANWLRTGQGGKLKTSEGNFPPFNDGSQENMPDNATDLFVAGDVRANEHAALTAMHTLFMREHNRLADQFAAEHPDWTDEDLYQEARRWVGAFMQVITYREFLPALLGRESMGPYQGYDSDRDPTIINSFSTAFYRVGHSMLTSDLLRLDEEGNEVPEGPLSLAEAFFDPIGTLLAGGIDPIIRGLAFQQMEEIDTKMVDEVRNFLFGPPGAGGLDLAALNIQRGRDHGLPNYNTLRTALGLPIVTNYQDITSDSDLALDLQTLFGSIDHLDPWVGALAEDHVPGASVGPSILNAVELQFKLLRSCDRFWYQNDPAFSPEDIQEIERTRLSHIIRRNTGITNIPEDVFRVP